MIMNVRFAILIALACVVLADPARASSWLSICEIAGNGPPVQIKNAKTDQSLAPLKPGDLIYKMADQEIVDERRPTFAFREGKLTEILPGMEELEKKKLVNCVGDEPKSPDYPIIVFDKASEAQLIYDEFGVISNFFTLDKVKLGKHSRCPISTHLFVSDSKRRELESKGIPLVRFCAAMSDNSWFWFDPETGQRRADFQMGGPEGLGAQFFFKPIPCFLAAATRVDEKRDEIRPNGCVFRYNPLTGAPISEEEGRALAKLAVFAFGPGERGGTLDDTEGLSKDSARRLSSIKIKIIKGE
jgi:hypothetical protein